MFIAQPETTKGMMLATIATVLVVAFILSGGLVIFF